ncbi:MAG: ATP-binding protein [Spirosomataceae bacterium]
MNLDLALQIAKNIKSKQKEAETYEQFVHLYRKQGNYQKALDMSQKFQKLTSEIINIETNKNAAELQEKYEADKREQQNKLLEADIETQKWQKQTIGIVACGLTLILLITGLAWWQIKNKNILLNHKNEELQAQKKQLENTLERLHQMREQLILSEKMASIGQLTAGIAHEINNPINFVSNNVQALKMDLTDIIQLMTKKQRENPHFITLNEEIQTLTESIERGIDRTQHIVNGLRIFARNEEAEFAKVDLHRCIDEALTLLSFEIKNRCQIIKRYGDITSVNGLHSKLNQVFLNILTNAVQAIWSIHPDSSSPTGSIEIVTLQAINMIEVRITDNGVGMDEETQKRIFEPFFTTKPIGEGTGLGMAICYGIILHHHGIISVSSKKGYGTTVLIELPI